jgi:hypothetical protein
MELTITHNRRYPSLTIHRSNLSLALSSIGLSPLISPDINILVNGGHLALSVTLSDPVLYLSDILLLRPQAGFQTNPVISLD